MYSNKPFDWNEPITLSNVVPGEPWVFSKDSRKKCATWHRVLISEDQGSGGGDLFLFEDGLRLLRSEALWHKPHVFSQLGGGLIRISYVFEYGAILKIGAKSLKIDAPLMSVFSTADDVLVETQPFAQHRQKLVSLAFTEADLLSLFGYDSGFEDCWRKIKPLLECEYYHRFPLDPKLAVHAKSIFDCQLNPAIAYTWMHSKAIELLCLTIEHFLKGKYLQSVSRVSLKSRDQVAIKRAREVLIQRVAKPPTVAELSALVGVNRNKLNNGFKELFGVTPQKFLEDRRFELAMEQVKKTDKHVGQIGYELGYQNQGSFSSAFKRYYGVSPSEARKIP